MSVSKFKFSFTKLGRSEKKKDNDYNNSAWKQSPTIYSMVIINLQTHFWEEVNLDIQGRLKLPQKMPHIPIIILLLL